jgi:hypothetical protein
MKKNETIIKRTLENVFNKLTVDVSAFIDFHGYKTAEIKVGSLQKTIGIGLYAPSSSIKMFFIDDQFEDGYQRLRPILNISYRFWQGEKDAWDIQFIDTTMVEKVGHFRNFSANMKAACDVIRAIKDEEQELLNKG